MNNKVITKQPLSTYRSNHRSHIGKIALRTAMLAALGAPLCAQSAVLEEIFVTATKRSESVQDVPISVAVVGGQEITNSGMSDLMDLASSVPNIKITDGVNNQNIFIRGIGSGIDRGLEQSVGMFIDGVYMGRSRQYRSPFLDLDRIEVLRGPQAVLFGKNTVAGAVKVETAKAELDDEVSGSVFVEYDPEYDDSKITGVINVPVSDTFAYRLAGSVSDKGGYFEDTNKDQDELESDEEVFRLSATWEASENLTVRGKLDYAESKTLGSMPVEISKLGALDGLAAFVLATAQANDPDLDGNLNYKKSTDNTNPRSRPEDERQEDKLFGALLHLEYVLGEHTLTSITSYSEYTSTEWQDTDFLPFDLLGQNNEEDFDQISQEIRLVSPGGETVDYIVGAYWQENRLHLPYDTAFEMSTLAPVVEAAVPGLGALQDWVNRQTDYSLDTESWSVFGEVTWNISDDLRATFGGRFSREEKDVFSATQWEDINGQQVDPVLDPTNLAAVSAFTLENALGVVATSPGEDDREESHFSPSFKINWDLNDEIMLYGSAQRGFKSGGFNSSPDVRPPVSEFEYEEEVVTGYEIGVLGIFRPKTTKCSGGPAIYGLQRGITFFDIPILVLIG